LIRIKSRQSELHAKLPKGKEKRGTSRIKKRGEADIKKRRGRERAIAWE